MKPVHRGSRIIPGRYGAGYCGQRRALLDDTHRRKIPQEEFVRVVLWLDSNSLRRAAYHDDNKQVRGELVWPILDVDPANRQGPKTCAP